VKNQLKPDHDFIKTGFINPPPKIPWLFKLGIWIAEKSTGKRMLPARLLSWTPRLAISSGIFEAMVIHKDKTLSQRLLKLVRLQTSFAVSCPFCIDMNALELDQFKITDEEIQGLQGAQSFNDIKSFDTREKLALEYARMISQTPLSFDIAFIETLKANFSEREIVGLAATVSQVNYWARLVQALGIPPAGFSAECQILNLDKYETAKR